MSLVIALVFVIIGFAIKNGKMYNLIAGYNTMSKEKQAQYDIEKIASLFRNVMITMAGIIVMGYIISKWLSKSQIEFYTVTSVVIIGVIYLNIVSNSGKYRNRG